MEKGPKLTLVGLVVVICMLAFVILVVFPFFSAVKRRASRVVCGTNLKGLGTAMTVYANDYEDRYPQLPGEGPWSKRLGFDYDFIKPDFNVNGAEGKVSRTITASWYLLVREADVSPKSFVCPYSELEPFDGLNPEKKDLVQLWDFGYDPHSHVSYSYHNPYGRFPADASRSAAFAVAADMSPWFKEGNFVSPSTEVDPRGNRPQIIMLTDESTWKLGTGRYHKSEGQNVLFADGHSACENQPNVGMRKDNIYTFWSVGENPTDQDRQGGRAPTSRSPENDAKSKEDSFLAI